MSNPTDEKVLVAVASKHGSTFEIAQALAAAIREGGFKVDLRELQKDEEVDDLDCYRAVILGSAIYAGNWLPEAKIFVEQHRVALSEMPLWFFSCGPLGEDEVKPKHNPAELKTGAGDLPILDHQIFLGKLDPSSLTFGERLVVKMVKAPSGDFREWEKVREWGRAIAGKLRSGLVEA
ncbi:MAG: flavodoxin domain-containing protein [Chloroflexi bacterium]|nr:flavodoxin domain-containing protein [Chloroflexota bacterium]OJV88310.1 MAG: hypothetical protein BGO39_11790 [Chloroflexi bacterium 54-19]